MPRLTSEELASRKRGLGATDIVEVNGLAPWKGAGPMRVYCEKLGILSSDDEESDPDEFDQLEWGHTMEPVIADWYAKRNGVTLWDGKRFQSVEHPFLWATLDRIVVGENRIVEIKNCGSPSLYRHWNASSQDGIPDYVRAQVTVQMGFSGMHECDVVACIGGRPPTSWRIFFDVDIFHTLIATAVAFWQCVQDKKAPDLDHTPSTRQYLQHRFPSNTDHNIREIDTLDMQLLAESRSLAAREEKDAAARRRKLDASMMAIVGDSDGIQGPWGKFLWKANSQVKRVSRFTPARGADE